MSSFKILSLSAILTLSLASCSTEYVPRNTIKVRTLNLNLENLRGPMEVRTRASGELISVDYFSISGDSALWLDRASRQPRAASMNDVMEIRVRDQVIGGVIGALGGAAAGVLTGVLVAGGRDQEIYVAGGLLIGEALGLFVGQMVGYPRSYVFDDPSSIPLPDTSRTGR